MELVKYEIRVTRKANFVPHLSYFVLTSSVHYLCKNSGMNTQFDVNKPIAIGADHAGYEYKTVLIGLLEDKGFEVKDCGTKSKDSVDYPDFAHPVAEAVESGEAGCGILVCGSGNGVAITANKHQNIRAAICWQSEVARLAREHN